MEQAALSAWRSLPDFWQDSVRQLESRHEELKVEQGRTASNPDSHIRAHIDILVKGAQLELGAYRSLVREAEANITQLERNRSKGR